MNTRQSFDTFDNSIRTQEQVAEIVKELVGHLIAKFPAITKSEAQAIISQKSNLFKNLERAIDASLADKLMWYAVTVWQNRNKNAKLLRNLNFTIDDRLLDQTIFPIKTSFFAQEKFALLPYYTEFHLDDVKHTIKMHNLRHTTLEECMSFAINFSDALKHYDIFALGSTHDEMTPCLYMAKYVQIPFLYCRRINNIRYCKFPVAFLVAENQETENHRHGIKETI